ncbi:MAG: glycosyltransferase family 39 protein [Candidatus Sabulitectum sp.]|nr:glycosyltransferase family 39 protein [Candidatus Sabulitectum sp.]
MDMSKGIVQRMLKRMLSWDIRRILITVFLLALTPRVVITMLDPHPPSAHWDVAHDVLIARNLSQGHGFANEPGHPTAYRYPLLPGVLSLFFRTLGERYIPFLLFQSLLGALVASMIAWLGYKAGGNILAYVAGILVAINPELVSYSRMMLSETIFSFLLCTVAVVSMQILSKEKVVPFFVLGVILGIATLCRPVAIIWGVLLAAILLFQNKHRLKKRMVLAVTLIAGCLLPVIPWLARNQIVMSSPVFATSGGITFWLFGHNNALHSDETTRVPEEYARVNREVDPKSYFTVTGGDPARMTPIYNMEPRYQAYSFEQSVVDRLSGLDEIAADRELKTMAFEYIRSHPLQTLRHSVSSVFCSFVYTEMGGRMNVIITLIMPFLLLGIYNLWRSSKQLALVILSSLTSMLIVYFIFFANHRFRVPYQPFLMLAGASGLIAAVKGNLSKTQKILFFGWMTVSVLINSFILFGDPTG